MGPFDHVRRDADAAAGAQRPTISAMPARTLAGSLSDLALLRSARMALKAVGVPFFFTTGCGEPLKLLSAPVDAQVLQKPCTLDGIARAMVLVPMVGS